MRSRSMRIRASFIMYRVASASRPACRPTAPRARTWCCPRPDLRAMPERHQVGRVARDAVQHEQRHILTVGRRYITCGIRPSAYRQRRAPISCTPSALMAARESSSRTAREHLLDFMRVHRGRSPAHEQLEALGMIGGQLRGEHGVRPTRRQREDGRRGEHEEDDAEHGRNRACARQPGTRAARACSRPAPRSAIAAGRQRLVAKTRAHAGEGRSGRRAPRDRAATRGQPRDAARPRPGERHRVRRPRRTSTVRSMRRQSLIATRAPACISGSSPETQLLEQQPSASRDA